MSSQKRSKTEILLAELKQLDMVKLFSVVKGRMPKILSRYNFYGDGYIVVEIRLSKDKKKMDVYGVTISEYKKVVEAQLNLVSKEQ